MAGGKDKIGGTTGTQNQQGVVETDQPNVPVGRHNVQGGPDAQQRMSDNTNQQVGETSLHERASVQGPAPTPKPQLEGKELLERIYQMVDRMVTNQLNKNPDDFDGVIEIYVKAQGTFSGRLTEIFRNEMNAEFDVKIADIFVAKYNAIPEDQKNSESTKELMNDAIMFYQSAISSGHAEAKEKLDRFNNDVTAFEEAKALEAQAEAEAKAKEELDRLEDNKFIKEAKALETQYDSDKNINRLRASIQQYYRMHDVPRRNQLLFLIYPKIIQAYEEGFYKKGSVTDCYEAISFYEQLEGLGFPKDKRLELQFRLAQTFEAGNKEVRDPPAALRIYESLMKAEFKGAQAKCGIMKILVKGPDRDVDGGYDLLKKALEADDAIAKDWLADQAENNNDKKAQEILRDFYASIPGNLPVNKGNAVYYQKLLDEPAGRQSRLGKLFRKKK